MASSLVVITGASSGIGEATAKLYASRGANVVLLARSKDRLERVAGEIKQAGGTANPYKIDLADSGCRNRARPTRRPGTRNAQYSDQ